MFAARKFAGVLALLCVTEWYALAQSDKAKNEKAQATLGSTSQKAVSRQHAPAVRLLTADDGLSILAAALETRVSRSNETDCSHLVHGIYERAGFPYRYASSTELYAGTPEFRRVVHPRPGDLVVWPGHVGILINPARHVFYSALSSGRGVDSYDAAYWKGRGHARFFRFVKRVPVEEPPAKGQRLLQTSRFDK